MKDNQISFIFSSNLELTQIIVDGLPALLTFEEKFVSLFFVKFSFVPSVEFGYKGEMNAAE